MWNIENGFVEILHFCDFFLRSLALAVNVPTFVLQAEDGKTELSLIHFAAMNPTWHPPQEAEQFIHEINEKISNPEELSRDVDRDRHSEALESVCLGVRFLFHVINVTLLELPVLLYSILFNLFAQLSMIASQHAQLQPVASSSKVGFPPAGRPEGLGTTSSYFFKYVQWFDFDRA